jgi:hypothetical protein
MRVWLQAATANVFTFADIVKTTFMAVKIEVSTDGSKVTLDTTDKRFAKTTFRSYPIKSFLVALNFASAATCAPLAAPGTGAHCTLASLVVYKAVRITIVFGPFAHVHVM